MIYTLSTCPFYGQDDLALTIARSKTATWVGMMWANQIRVIAYTSYFLM